jgi:hypothetical protein
MTIRSTFLVSMAALGGLALVACGGDDGGATPADTDGTGTDDGTAGPATMTMTTTTMTSADGTDDTGDTGDTGDTTGTPVGTAMVRVIHGAPDAPAVDVYVEGVDTPIITDLAYGETTEYLEVDAGEYNFQVRAAGSPATDEPVYETGVLPVPEGAVVTALAAGLLAGKSADDAFRVVPLVEGFSAPAAGNAIVRVVHAGADAPTVGIDVGNDGTVEVEALGRFADTGAPGVELPAGAALQIGIVAGDATVTAFTTPELPDGAELFVIATGLLGRLPREEAGFSLLAVGPTGSVGFVRQNPRVYALHASPDAGSVDVCAGETALFSGVPYATLAPVQVPPGEYDLSFFAAGLGCDGDPVGTFTTPALAAGEQYLAIATGELTREAGDPDFTLAPFVEQFTLDAADGNGVVRVIHAASAPEVAAGVVAGGEIAEAGVLVSAIAWPEESDELEVPAMTYPIGVVPSDATFPAEPIATFDVPVTDGGRTWVVATGQLTGNPGFSLWAIDTTASPWTLTDLGG